MPKGVLGRIVALVDVHQCCLRRLLHSHTLTSLTNNSYRKYHWPRWPKREWLLLLAVRLQHVCVNNIQVLEFAQTSEVYSALLKGRQMQLFWRASSSCTTSLMRVKEGAGCWQSFPQGKLRHCPPVNSPYRSLLTMPCWPLKWHLSRALWSGSAAKWHQVTKKLSMNTPLCFQPEAQSKVTRFSPIIAALTNWTAQKSKFCRKNKHIMNNCSYHNWRTKTTVAVNLAAALRKKKVKGYFWLIDSQANTTFATGLIKFQFEEDNLKKFQYLSCVTETDDFNLIQNVARQSHAFNNPEIDVIPSLY